MTYSFSPLTRNEKLGFMATSMSPKQTCPDSCALKVKGCYAQAGRLNINWERLSRGEYGLSFDELLSGLKKLPKGFGFRHNQAGDLCGDNLLIDTKKLSQLTSAVSHLHAYAYTHKPVLKGKAHPATLKKNRKAIKKANDEGFTVNVSCDRMNEVDEALSLGIAPAVVVLPINAPKTQFTKGGNKVIVCPNQVSGVTCADCMLCHKQRSVTVGFRAHGVSKGAVDRMLTTNN